MHLQIHKLMVLCLYIYELQRIRQVRNNPTGSKTGIISLSLDNAATKKQKCYLFV